MSSGSSFGVGIDTTDCGEGIATARSGEDTLQSVSGEGKNFNDDENRSANQAVEMSVMIHRLQSDNWPASWDAAFDAQLDLHHGMSAIG